MRFWVLLVMASCGYSTPADVARVTGTVHGLWDGNDGVTLHLTSVDVDRALTITADGPFELPDLLVAGSTYSVEVAANPTAHTCLVSHGAGAISDDAPAVDVACLPAPRSAIALSAPAPWTFDPTLNTQTVPVSLLTQAVSVTVTGALDAVQIDGVQVGLGVASTRQMLPPGQTSFAVVAQASGLAKAYAIVVDRGARALEQSAYVKESVTHTTMTTSRVAR